MDCGLESIPQLMAPLGSAGTFRGGTQWRSRVTGWQSLKGVRGLSVSSLLFYFSDALRWAVCATSDATMTGSLTTGPKATGPATD